MKTDLPTSSPFFHSSPFTLHSLFAWPNNAHVGRAVPKTTIFKHAKPSRAVRDLFASEVAEIVWAYKLSPETINLPIALPINEIQVFRLALKGEELSEAVFAGIDKAIPYPIVFELVRGEKLKTVVGYKRPSEAGGDHWIVEAYFHSPWLKSTAPRAPLPHALDLAGLYGEIVSALMELPRRPGEPLASAAARCLAVRKMTKEIAQLEAKMNREAQFNRKVALNAELRLAKRELERVKGEE